MTDGKVKIKEVIEKNKNIISLKINDEGSLLIFRTIENRYYLYSINDEFEFERFSRMNRSSVNILFSLSSSKILLGLANGNIFEQLITSTNDLEIFEHLSS